MSLMRFADILANHITRDSVLLWIRGKRIQGLGILDWRLRDVWAPVNIQGGAHR